MKPRVLFIVTGDPRTSPRPAEAVRIAAGVGVWQRSEISVYLRGGAVLALSEAAMEEGLIEEDNYAQYWKFLFEAGSPLYVQKGAAALRQLGAAGASVQEISDAELAKLAAEQTYLLRF